MAEEQGPPVLPLWGSGRGRMAGQLQHSMSYLSAHIRHCTTVTTEFGLKLNVGHSQQVCVPRAHALMMRSYEHQACTVAT